jgi:hypothetical protein
MTIVPSEKEERMIFSCRSQILEESNVWPNFGNSINQMINEDLNDHVAAQQTVL